MGTPGNLRNLEAVAPALAEVCRRHGARVRVVCSVEPRLPDVPVEFVRWSAEREVEDLLPLDVGLAPLLDGPRQRCKCALKSLQYMAAGLPVVTSPVGANRTVVRDGETGFHVESAGDWTRSLDRLIVDAGLRRRMGDQGRRDVETRWSFDRYAAAFESAVRGVDCAEPSGREGRGKP